MIEDPEDFFEKTPEEVPVKEKEPKKPKYKSDDPRYYEEEESQWEHLKPAPYRRGPFLWISVIVILGLCFLSGIYIWLFSPKVQQAVQYGYVENVQKEGTVFHTFEGVILPYKSLMDTVRPYEGDFVFSTKDDAVATSLLKKQGKGMPVKVTYKVYRQALPWRGNSRIIVTEVDSVDPKVILPPDRQPEVIKSPLEPKGVDN